MRPFLILCLLTLGILAQAQNREMSIGLRLGSTNGLYFDIDTRDLSTLRIQLSDRNQGQQITVLKYNRFYQHEKLPADFSFYYGFGAHGGFTRWSVERDPDFDDDYYQKMAAPIIGLDGLFGITYHLRDMPLIVSLEAKPYFDLGGRNLFSVNPFDVGISAAFVF